MGGAVEAHRQGGTTHLIGALLVGQTLVARGGARRWPRCAAVALFVAALGWQVVTAREHYALIMKRGERIYVGIPERDAQCLFACHRTRRPGVPVGVVLYLRTHVDLLRILHVVVGPAYEYGGQFGNRDVATHLVNEVRRVAARIGGVRRIALPYRRGSYLSVAPRRAG